MVTAIESCQSAQRRAAKRPTDFGEHLGTVGREEQWDLGNLGIHSQTNANGIPFRVYSQT